jgi:hypothetical protein
MSKFPQKEDEFDWLTCMFPEMKGQGAKSDIVVGKITGKIPMSNLYYDQHGRVYEVLHQKNEPSLWQYVFSILTIEQ